MPSFQPLYTKITATMGYNVLYFFPIPICISQADMAHTGLKKLQPGTSVFHPHRWPPVLLNRINIDIADDDTDDTDDTGTEDGNISIFLT